MATWMDRAPGRFSFRCVAQGEPSDVTMLARDYAAYVRGNKDAEPLMVIDDRVPQDGGCTAYPAVAPIVAGDHLAELAHDQEGDEAGDGVAEDHRRSGAAQHAGGAEEKPGADGSAQRDELDMPVLQPALKRAGV